MLQTVRIGRHKRRLAGQTGNPDVSTAIQVAPSTLGRADPGSVPGTGYEKELRPVGLKNCKKLGGILEEFLNSLRKPVLPKSEFGGILALENEPANLTASNRIDCGCGGRSGAGTQSIAAKVPGTLFCDGGAGRLRVAAGWRGSRIAPDRPRVRGAGSATQRVGQPGFLSSQRRRKVYAVSCAE